MGKGITGNKILDLQQIRQNSIPQNICVSLMKKDCPTVLSHRNIMPRATG